MFSFERMKALKSCNVCPTTCVQSVVHFLCCEREATLCMVSCSCFYYFHVASRGTTGKKHQRHVIKNLWTLKITMSINILNWQNWAPSGFWNFFFPPLFLNRCHNLSVRTCQDIWLSVDCHWLQNVQSRSALFGWQTFDLISHAGWAFLTVQLFWTFRDFWQVVSRVHLQPELRVPINVG